MTFTVPFTDTGLPIGANDSNMTYLYGLSDFFAVMFEDTSKLNMMLEAESYVASEVYSRFLQYSSALSLEGIQENINGSIELCLLNESDSIPGKVNTYKLPKNVAYSKHIANRAFLPTELLDNEVDYKITRSTNGDCFVQFAKPLSRYAFPVRTLNSTNTDQYALWFVDAEIDEQLVSKFYGNLIGVTPENSTSKFADFVYGLFYVYMHGPRLDTLSRGLNLALGIPVARSNEIVLSIRTYLDTDQYLVICDQNQYLIPYGLEPTCREGDTLVLGDPLASWVEIKDYEHDGEWWINLFIPEKIIKEVPSGQKDRYATSGSHFDYLMRNYLKTHTFMVKVNVTNFKNIQLFSQISDIISRAKPSYTESIYIWAVSMEDTLDMTDSMAFNYDARWDDAIGPCISRLHRGNLNDPIIRGGRSFIRFNASNKVAAIVGEDTYVSNQLDYFGQELIHGYVNPLNNLRQDSPTEQGWVRAILNRGNISMNHQRNKIGFHRNVSSSEDTLGVPSYYESAVWKPDLATKMVPLYTIPINKLTEKMEAAGYPPPGESEWWFEIFSIRDYGQSINDMAINYLPPDYNPNALANNYDLFMRRGESTPYLGREFNERSYQSWYPEPRHINTGDHLLCIRITETVVGVYWVTTSSNLSIPAAFFCDTLDPLLITYDMPLSRNGGSSGCPFYTMRGRGYIESATGNSEINGNAINTDTINGLNEEPITSGSYLVSFPLNPIFLDSTSKGILRSDGYYWVYSSRTADGNGFIVSNSIPWTIFMLPRDSVDVAGSIESYTYTQMGTMLLIENSTTNLVVSVPLGSITLRTTNGSTSISRTYVSGGLRIKMGTQIVGDPSFDPASCIVDPMNMSSLTTVDLAPTVKLNYSDKYNLTRVIDRSGITLKHAVELL